MGSKSKIAREIISFLPKGERLVDLFGGGFAISHCACLCKKWNAVYYNDFNPLIVNLIKDAIEGKFNYKVFKPEFITREDFNRLKDTDGYVKYIWSFGNNGQAYLFGKEVEHIKYLGHQLVVFGKLEPELYKIAPDILKYVNGKSINQRRLQFHNYFKVYTRLQQLEYLERLQQLEHLQRLERLQQLEIHCHSYEDYVYKEGDVVYCDIPYEDTAEYSGGFDHKKFYEWCYNQPYQIFFSSYKISDPRFKLVWASQKKSLLTAKSRVNKYECIYTNK